MQILLLIKHPQPLQQSLRIYKKEEFTLSTLDWEDLTRYKVLSSLPNAYFHTELKVQRVK